jgi:riboflavin biosynthesis pyrimidine reductase
VLVEGGPSVAHVLLAAGLVDEAVIYQGGRPAGNDGLLPFADQGLDRLTASGQFIQTQTRNFGPDRMTAWQRKSLCLPALSAT